MPETPKRPADTDKADVPRTAKKVQAAAPIDETARAADSVPVAGGPFTVLPTQFGRYRIEKLLGKGAMGAVYLAHDTQLDRSVALKVARVSTAGSARLIQRMETEAKAAAKVDHPHICKVYDFGEIEGIHFIALQYIDGEDLKTYLKRVGRKREPAEALNLIIQIARALKAAHDKGVLHRDLKPENVMLNQHGEPVIMDFGLARRMTGATNAGLTQGMILGTAAYMSPEQAIGKAEGIDHRSDLYALGLMLFEMLTGEWPFTGSAIEVMGQKSVQEPPSPLSLNPNLPPQLAAVCQRMIAKKKEDRYGSCAELVAALESIDLTAQVALEMDVEPPEAPSHFAVQDGPSFDFLDQNSLAVPSIVSTPTGKKAISAKKRSPLVPDSLLKWWRAQPTAFRGTIAGAAAVCLLLAMTLFFRSGDARVKVTIDSDNVHVTFQDESIKLKDGTHEYKIKPGDHKLHIKSDGIEFETEKFTLKQGNNPTVTIELIDAKVVAKLGSRTLTTSISGETPANGKIANDGQISNPGEWIDLLEWAEGVDWAPRGIDWNANVEGKPTKNGITLKRAQFMRFPLPAIIDGDYELEVEFTRHDGIEGVNIFFPVGIHTMRFELGSQSTGVSAVTHVDGNRFGERRLVAFANNALHRVFIRVRHHDDKSAFNVDWNDNKDYIKWEGTQSTLTNLAPGWAWGLSMIRHPWIGSFDNNCRFQKIRVRKLSGTIRRDVITYAEREQDQKDEFVRLVNKTGNLIKVGFAQFVVSQIPLSADAGQTERMWPLITRNFKFCDDFYGAHAPSRLKCPIPAGAKSFSAIGYNDTSRIEKYLVYVDGKQVYDSGVTDIAIAKIGIPDKSTLLELVIDPAGDARLDHTYWCYPRFHSVAADKLTDEMLDGEPGPLKFAIASNTVGAQTLTHNQAINTLKSVPIHFRDATPCDEFLLAHAPSTVTYVVPEGMTRFTAIGYNVNSHHVKYEVWADAKRIYESPQAGVVRIDVELPSGTKTIELKVNDLGQNGRDWSYWCYPRLHRK